MAQARTLPIPLPTKQATHLVQAEVDLALYTATHKEMKSRKVKIRQVVEWAMSNYLLATNPKEAERLKISADLK